MNFLMHSLVTRMYHALKLWTCMHSCTWDIAIELCSYGMPYYNSIVACKIYTQFLRIQYGDTAISLHSLVIIHAVKQ